METRIDIIKPIETEGRFVRICKVCNEPKKKSQFYRERLNEMDGKDGWSDDCRSCRMKQKKIDRDIWLAEVGWKRT